MICELPTHTSKRCRCQQQSRRKTIRPCWNYCHVVLAFIISYYCNIFQSMNIRSHDNSNVLNIVISFTIRPQTIHSSHTICTTSPPSMMSTANTICSIRDNRLSQQSNIIGSVSKLYAKKVGNKKTNNNDDDDVDIPDDWSEDDVLAEFDDVVVGDDDDDVDVDAVRIVVDDDDSSIDATTLLDATEVSAIDDDEDDIDVDNIDLDEEEDDDEEDSIVEEAIVGAGTVIRSNSRSKSLFDQEDIILQQTLQQYGYDDPRIGDVYVPWDPEEDEIEYELQEDASDPNYMTQLQLVQEAVDESEKLIKSQNFDPIELLYGEQQTDEDGNVQAPLTDEQMNALDQMDIVKLAQERAQNLELTEMDIESMDIEKEYEAGIDLMLDEPYPRHETDEYNFLEANTDVTDDDMEELDRTYKGINELTTVEPWDKVMLASIKGLDHLDNETISEMEECLEEIGGSAYNVTNWLLYDLDFNISNLILAAVKHNPSAPILFQHWYPQLVTYSRYEHARQRDYDFTWADVEQADMVELEQYYSGFGYTSIPSKAPSETGIITLDELDEEEIKMAAFETWMTDVYNPEGDRKDFDDDTLRDEDNVFSKYYEAPQHPDLPNFDDAVDDIESWKRDELGMLDENNNPVNLLQSSDGVSSSSSTTTISNEDITPYDDVMKYTNMMGQVFKYNVVQDNEFVQEFRGHLIIACTGMDSDLEIAEKITTSFYNEFGKSVFVETRVLAIARDEDNVYEIWLESYNIDLLHSKKRATSGAKGWTGPADINDEHIEYLKNQVKFLISDDARYSYRYELELVGA